ncbi:MAG TPA: extracellular solute-binding protein [Burkholderiales bacterium]|jgi:iron(III) transport system substrate-binding protein|nr:extracellular solute-binding protein [Burkholderiales bacterium]
MRTPLAALVLFLCTACLCTAGLAQDRSLTLYTSLAPTESGPLAQAFEKKTGIKVELWRAISEKVVQRAITEARARRFTVDVIETNAPEMEMMAREKLFAELDSPYLADLPKGAVPKHRLWIPDRMNFFVVAYNTTKVRREELPKDYLGFLDPKWKGRIGIEATDAEWMATLVKKWGTEAGLAYFRKLAELRPDVRKGHVLLAELIAAGEIPVGLTVYNANAESLKRKGAPIDWVPVQPVVARPQGIAVARNAPNPKAARAFVDFVLSPEGQELLVSMGRVPASTKVRTHLNDFEYTVVDPITVLDEQDKWNRLWEELFIRGEAKR